MKLFLIALLCCSPMPKAKRVALSPELVAYGMAQSREVTSNPIPHSLITLVTQDATIINHGGYELSLNVGANKSDTITVDVTCDHVINGFCYVGAPRLQDGTKFVLVENESGHQKWSVTVPTTGDQFVLADYYWVGTDVHYTSHIVSTENL
jgi:hypothetical protein